MLFENTKSRKERGKRGQDNDDNVVYAIKYTVAFIFLVDIFLNLLCLAQS